MISKNRRFAPIFRYIFSTSIQQSNVQLDGFLLHLVAVAAEAFAGAATATRWRKKPFGQRCWATGCSPLLMGLYCNKLLILHLALRLAGRASALLISLGLVPLPECTIL
jgi:hypothetical protein